MSKGVVSIVVGGVKRSARVELRSAVDIEAETGVGTFRLVQDFARGDGKLSHALVIVRVALAANGMPYTDDDMLDHAARDGIVATMANATRVLKALFEGMEKGAGKAQAGARAETSEPANTH